MSEAQFGAGLFGAFMSILGTIALVGIVSFARRHSRTRYHKGWR